MSIIIRRLSCNEYVNTEVIKNIREIINILNCSWYVCIRNTYIIIVKVCDTHICHIETLRANELSN